MKYKSCFKEDLMRNPIRTYMHWYGSELVQISKEPTWKAIRHHASFSTKVMGISLAAGLIVGGTCYVGMKIHEKISDMKEEYEWRKMHS